MQFIKEKPMNTKKNLHHLKQELDTEHALIRTIHTTDIQEAIGFLLLHCFDKEDKSLELGFRINPDLQRKWACSQAVKQAIHETREQGAEIQKIIGRHSAWNKWSFWVFKKNGFSLEDFVPSQTHLPNIGKTTDDFKRAINKNLFESIHNNWIIEIINPTKKELILLGLQKYNFISK